MDALVQLGLGNALMAAVLAVLVAGVGRVCRRPALLHGLWLLVLVKLVTPSFVAYRIPWLDKHEQAAVTVMVPAAPLENPQVSDPEDAILPQADATGNLAPDIPLEGKLQLSVDEPESAPANTRDAPDPTPAWEGARAWMPVLAGIWLAGSVGWFSYVAYRIYRFQSLLCYACPASAELCAQAQRLAGCLGLAACPALWLLPGRLSPMVWALVGRPRILVPSALWERLTLEQQATLLVHELAHLRRRDQWVRGLELLVTGLYWWHPVVWWACREIREAEEQCCDAWVLSTLPRAGRAYATALLETIDFLSETRNALPVVASGIGHVHDLRRRLTMIMHGTTPRALSGAGLVLVLGLGAFLLPLRPTWGQDDEPRNRRRAQAEEQQGIAEAAQARQEEVQAARARVQARDQQESIRAERQRLAEEVQRMRAQLDRAMADFKQAEARLAQLQDAERNASRDAVRQQIETTRPRNARGRPSEQPRAAEPERRLEELERKLDALLEEVQSLRREMRRSGPGMRPSSRPPETTPTPGYGAPSRSRREDGRPGQPPLPSVAPAAPALPRTPAPPAAPSVAPAAPAPAASPAVRPSGPAPTPSSAPEPSPAPAVRSY